MHQICYEDDMESGANTDEGALCVQPYALISGISFCVRLATESGDALVVVTLNISKKGIFR